METGIGTRQLWMDNLRSAVVLLVLFFHVFYYYGACCDGSGIGGFSDSQWQDCVIYILYPWMMMLLFIVSGVSSRYALQKYSPREFRRSRTVRLLVPGTIGLLVWQWTAGYFNLQTAAVSSGQGAAMFADMPSVAYFLLMVITGGGHLWFIQLLWVFAFITPWLPAPKRAPRALWSYLFLGFLLLWAAGQTVLNLQEAGPLALVNVYRPLVYLVCYLLGFYIFTEQAFLDLLDRLRWPLILAASVGAVLITVFTFGQDPYSGLYLRSWYNNLYAWVMCLAMVAVFRRWANAPLSNLRGAALLSWLNSASYGIYLLHYLFICGVGYMLRMYTTLPAWADYLLLFLAVFTFTPLLYELFRRIPFIRWTVLGIRKRK